MNITFKPSRFDGDASDNSFTTGLVYLSVTADGANDQYAGSIAGWVRPEVRSLVKAAPELLETAQALLDAFGGDTPSWCSFETQALATAIARAKGAA